jgi:hypothetical protein
MFGTFALRNEFYREKELKKGFEDSRIPAILIGGPSAGFEWQ